MGWDAFGLPAENYAIKHKLNPKISTAQNINNFKKQIKKIGTIYDWTKEINTTDPQYYKWTQWIFLKMYKKGLAYQSNMPINWCPKCLTGLANEEVVNGKCERCNTTVTKTIPEVQEMLKQQIQEIAKVKQELTEKFTEFATKMQTMQMGLMKGE